MTPSEDPAEAVNSGNRSMRRPCNEPSENTVVNVENISERSAAQNTQPDSATADLHSHDSRDTPIANVVNSQNLSASESGSTSGTYETVTDEENDENEDSNQEEVIRYMDPSERLERAIALHTRPSPPADPSEVNPNADSEEATIVEKETPEMDTHFHCFHCNKCGFPLLKASDLLQKKFTSTLNSSVFCYELDWLADEVAEAGKIQSKQSQNDGEPSRKAQEPAQRNVNPESQSTYWCYSATNPSQQRFDIIRVSGKINTIRSHILDNSEPSTEHSWFPPYSWKTACCAICSQHLGWYFQGETPENESESSYQFFGVILTSLVLRSVSTSGWRNAHQKLPGLIDAESQYQRHRQLILRALSRAAEGDGRMMDAMTRLHWMDESPMDRIHMANLHSEMVRFLQQTHSASYVRKLLEDSSLTEASDDGSECASLEGDTEDDFDASGDDYYDTDDDDWDMFVPDDDMHPYWSSD